MRYFKMGLMLAATFALWAVGCLCLQLMRTAAEVEKTATELHQTANAATSLVQEAHGRLVGTSQNLNAILIQAGLATDEARRAATEQRQYWNQMGASSLEVLNSANQAVNGLNTVTLDADRQINRLADSTVEALAEVPPTLQAAQGALGQGTQTLKDGSEILTSPDIAATLSNVNQTSASLAHIAAMLEKRAQQMLKPANMTITILEKLLGMGGSAAQIVK